MTHGKAAKSMRLIDAATEIHETHASRGPMSGARAAACRLAPHRAARWRFRLSDALLDDLVNATRSGAPIAPVLARHKVTRKVYYSWLRIGRGEQTTWWDGCPIQDHVLAACRRLVRGVLEARLERARAELAAFG